MSHHIYTTEGLVLKSTPVGEANLFLSILTRDLGLIGARAAGIRETKSKLRYNLQDFSIATVSFVRGRSNWRVTNARARSNLYENLKSDPDRLTVLAQVCALIRALSPGEEKNTRLFSIVSSAFDFLKAASLSKDSLLNFESVLVLRILHTLGYVAELPLLNEFIKSDEWSRELIANLNGQRLAAIAEINRSLKASQLIETKS